MRPLRPRSPSLPPRAAFGNPFGLLVNSLKAHFKGQPAQNVFVWLDVFAINQHGVETDTDLQGGETLKLTIGFSAATLAVLDPVRRSVGDVQRDTVADCWRLPQWRLNHG